MRYHRNTLSQRVKKDRNPYYLKDSGAPAKESMRQDLNLRPLRPERNSCMGT